MPTIGFQIAQLTLAVEFPCSFSTQAEILFPDFKPIQANQMDIHFLLQENQQGTLQLFEADKLLANNLDLNRAAVALMNEVIRSVAENTNQYIALHAAAVTKSGINLVIPANTGSGKTSMAAWLVSRGYKYLTDELVLFSPLDTSFEAFYRPFNVKPSGLEVAKQLIKSFNPEREIKTNDVIIWPVEFIGEYAQRLENQNADLFIFPCYSKDSELVIEALSPAQTGMELMACNVNARNLEDHGFKQISEIARQVAGIRLVYSSFEQLEPLLLELVELVANKAINFDFLRKLLKATPASGKFREKTTFESQANIPVATVKTGKRKLCIGMATYDDYDGVYFSTQAIRLYHPEVTEDTEILVLDNHPTGKCAQDLKLLDSKIKHYRYQPVADKTSTAIRDQIFEYTDADYVLCMDCHVLLEPGAIKKLLAYFEAHPNSIDLLQGPMYSDDLKRLSTHFKPLWNKGMYGVWGYDERAKNLGGPAFDIPMQGLGLFACRKQAWPGFNSKFRGFGGEEGYIHEKFRQAGGRTLCLPFLRWMHRFARPMGVPYPINWSDRIRNYLIGFTELGLDIQPIIEHFNEHLNKDITTRTVAAFEQEFKQST